MNKPNKKLVVASTIVVMAITLSACASTPSINIPGIGRVGGSGAATDPRAAAAAAKQVKVTTGSIENHIVATGQVTARQAVNLEFVRSGTLTKILVKEGDLVKAGQVVATLDNSDLTLSAKQQWDNYLLAQAVYSQTLKGPTTADLQNANAAVWGASAAYNALSVGPTEAQLAGLRATLQNAQADIKQKQAAYDKAYSKNQGGIGATPESLALEQSTNALNLAKANYDNAFAKPSAPTLAQASANISAAQAKVDALKPTSDAIDQARLKMNQAFDSWTQADNTSKNGTIVATFDGLITSVPANVGDQVGSNTVIATLADFATPQFTVSVDEADLGNIKLGQDATIALQSYTGNHLPAKVSSIAHAGTTVGNVITFKVTLDLVPAKDQPNILMGMSGTSQVITSKADNVVVVPAALVVTDPRTKTTTVNVLDVDGTSKTVTVKTGLANADSIQILSGVSAGDTLLAITRAAPTVNTGIPGARGFGG